MSLAQAVRDAGKVNTRNSAMPGPSFALPTKHCITGRKLAAIENSVCAGCYATKSERMYTSVRKGWGSNYLAATKMIAEAPDKWSDAMAFQVKHHCAKLGEPFMRWFDAGDLQSVQMLRAIVATCVKTATIKHWLPTREGQIVAQWKREGGTLPDNLVIRISSTMIGDAPRDKFAESIGVQTSTVHRHGDFTAEKFGHDCPKANKTHTTNSCEDCRNCWDPAIENVSYQFHH